MSGNLVLSSHQVEGYSDIEKFATNPLNHATLTFRKHQVQALPIQNRAPVSFGRASTYTGPAASQPYMQHNCQSFDKMHRTISLHLVLSSGVARTGPTGTGHASADFRSA